MPYVSTQDGARIFYKGMGSGQPVLFSPSWTLSADAWDPQLVFVGTHQAQLNDNLLAFARS